MRLPRAVLRLVTAIAVVGSGLVFGVAGPVAAATTPAITTIPVAAGPAVVGVNPRTDTIYVASNHTSVSRMTVVSGGTGTKVTTFAIASGPYPWVATSVTVDPTLNKVWVLAGNVYVVTGANNSASSGPAVGTTPDASGLDPNTHRIYADNTNNYRYLSIITANTDTLTQQIHMTTTAATLLAMTVDAKTNTVYAQSSGDGLAVYNGTTGALTHYGGLCRANKIAVDPTTNIVYLACTGSSGSVEVVNGATLALISTISVGDPQGIAVDPVTDRIFVTNYTSNTVSVIDGATNTVVATVSVGSRPEGVAVNPTTDTVYVANSGSTLLTVLKYPTTVPSAPQGVTAKATGTRSAYVRWTPPVSNGGLPITGYTVTASPGGKTCTTTTATTCSIKGLTQGVSYNFTVAATNSDGTGSGTVSGSVTPSYAGSATIQLTAHCSTVTTDPVTDMVYVGCQKGTPAHAVVEAITGMEHSIVGSVSLSTTTVTQITQLAFDNRLHKLFVMGGHANGSNGYLVTITSLTYSVMSTVGLNVYTSGCISDDSPGGVAVDPSNNRVFASIRGYCSGTGWTFFFTGTTGKQLGYVHRGIGVAEYSSSVGKVFVAEYSSGIYIFTGSTDAAITSVGTGEYANAIAIDTTTNMIYAVGQSATRSHYHRLGIINGTTPYAKTTVSVGATTGVAVDTSTDRVLVPNDATVGEISILTGRTGASVTTVPSDGHSPTVVAVDHTTVTADVVNTWSGGTSYDSSTLHVVAEPASPFVTATAGNASATVSWSANTGGAPITSYSVTSSPGGGSCTTSSTSCTITGLTNGTTYTFAVTATNIMGTGTPGVSNSVIPELPPPTVKAPTTVTWGATISGTDQLASSAITAHVTDTTPGQVWHLTADLAAVPATPNGHHLGTVTAKCNSTSPVTLTPGTAVTVCTGPGTVTETVTLSVVVASNAYAGSYSASLTWKATP